MNNKLKELVETIYNEYSPLQNLDQQLIQKKGQQDFRKLVELKTEGLSPQDRLRIFDEFFDWGPLVPLTKNPSIYDIVIQGPHHIFYEDAAGMHQLEDEFLSLRSFTNFTELLQKEAHMLVNQKDPFGNGKARGFRVHLAIAPIAQQISITLRKHNEQIFSFPQLETQGFLSLPESALIQQLINENKNMLIVGPTGSGKTTFLNSMLSQVSSKERLVIIEDTDEVRCSSSLACKLLSREICPTNLTPVTMEDLVKQSLRMRPDRIVIGEVRGPEAKDLLQALATGHSGSLGTLHAQTGKQALLRLEMLIQMGAPQWSLHSIRQLIQMSLDYLVVLTSDRMEKGIKEICKIGSHEKFGILLQTMNLKTPLVSKRGQSF